MFIYIRVGLHDFYTVYAYIRTRMKAIFGICRKKNIYVLTSRPVQLSTGIHVNVYMYCLQRFQCVDRFSFPSVYRFTCRPFIYMAMLLFVFFYNTFNAQPVHLLTCLPVHNVHVKIENCFYNTLSMPLCLCVYQRRFFYYP